MSKKERIYLLDHSSMLIAPLKRIVALFPSTEIQRYDSFDDARNSLIKDMPLLILANWDTPDADGVSMLKKLRSAKKTSTIPMILFTRERPMDEVQRAMREGAHDVLGVPIDWNFLHRHLVRIYDTAPELQPGEFETEAEVVVLNQLDSVTRLTPLPQIAQQVLAISSDPESSAEQLADIVKQDPTITANVLKLVNSAAYGYRREISNIKQAIIVLGFNEVRDLTVTAALTDGLELSEGRLFSRKNFWLHSLASAHIAKKIADKNPKLSSDDAFIIGLLHDIGDVILDQHFHEKFQDALETADIRREQLALAERRRIGVDHAEVGGVVARNWGLPVSLEKAIMYHHEPWRGDKWDHSIFLAHASNQLAAVAGYGLRGNPRLESPYADAFTQLGLKGKTLKEILDSLEVDLSHLKQLV